MKIIPNSDILIEGRHCEKGKVTEASDLVAKSLIAQRLAVPAKAQAPAKAQVETATAPQQKIETAAKRK